MAAMGAQQAVHPSGFIHFKIKPDCPFSSSGTHTDIHACVRGNREWVEEYPTALGVCLCVLVIPPMAH